MIKIFISYKRQDKDIVFPVVDEIRQKTGIDCWIDLEGIESGDQFQNVIIDAIDNADIVVFMLSKNFIAPYRDEKTGKIDPKKQTFPEKEVMYALRHGKRLLPISIDGTSVFDCKWLEFNCSGLDCINWNDVVQHDKLIKNFKQWGVQDEDKDVIVNIHRGRSTIVIESHPEYACLNINVNETCEIYRFGRRIGFINRGDWGELFLRTGRHELSFVSVNKKIVMKVIEIPSVDYTDYIRIVFEESENEDTKEIERTGSNGIQGSKIPRKSLFTCNTIADNKGCVITMTIALVLLIIVLPLGYLNFCNDVSELPNCSNPSISSKEYSLDEISEEKGEITQSVDLGLTSGTLWADKNIGAKHIGDYGELYSWGEVETKKDYRQLCYSNIDAMRIIRTEYDVAMKILGSDWQLPSQAQFDELIRECSWEWKDNGFSVVGKNGNSIFLPASGWSCSSVVEYKNKYGYYWTGEKVNSTFAKELIFSNSEYKTGNGYLYYGRSIRAVKKN